VNLFAGEVQDGKMNGFGVLAWPDGRIYEGQWRDGKAHGRGTLTEADGRKYDGEWKVGHFEIVVFSVAVLNRLMQHNKIHGKGTYVDKYGRMYHGEWRNSVKNGRGMMSITFALL
jgi:hypothetical protein